MATITGRVNGDGTTRWEVQVRLRGHPAATARFERKTDAKKWAAQTEAAIREGRYFPTAEARRHTLADLLDRYIKDVLPAKKNARAQRPHFDWWRAELGALRLTEVTAARIGEARDKLAATPTNRGPRSPASVNRYLAALSHAFTVAVKDWQWTETNPVTRVRKPREPRGRVRFLDDAERVRLLEATKAGPAWLEPVVTLSIATAMRQGEILGLRWADVDLGKKRLVLHDTKNGERRAVHLAGPALDLLKRWSKVRKLGEPLVFPEVSSFWWHWTTATEAAELADLRFHDLRHTAASYLAMNGATLSEIAAVLGHKTLAMVKRYAHLSESHVAGVVERMNERVFGPNHH